LDRRPRAPAAGGRGLTVCPPDAALLAAVERRADLLFLKRLIEAGELTPVIDRTYTLNEAPKALSDANEGHGRGKAVITI
jgi:NADPH:quinone reductase-like Zn-dependent oxidoreductase